MVKDRLITFYEPVYTKTASGAEKLQYQAVTPKSWASVDFLFSKGLEKSEGKQTVASSSIQLKIWYRDDIRESFLLEMEGTYYDIQKISEGKIRRKETLVEAKAKDNDRNIDILTP